MAKSSNQMIDTTPSTVATSALQSLPFGTIIGGPLKACVEAQTEAAQATWKFIQQVGLVTDEDGNRTLAYVSFTYRKNGHEATINVPLLTIVPIPYIAIRDIDIAFKANISAAASTSTSEHESLDVDFNMNTQASVNYFMLAKASMEMNVGVSSKKDSSATRDSKYSVEYTMDVAVKAGQDDMPAGMAKVLEMLNESIDTVDKGGELHVSSNVVQLSSENGGNGVYVTYKNDAGYYENKIKDIKFGVTKLGDDSSRDSAAKEGEDYKASEDDPGIICMFKKPGRYKITVGQDSKTSKAKSAVVTVIA